eukprot:symbB.v1.2.007093.t1/scaffold431.1/size205911/6
MQEDGVRPNEYTFTAVRKMFGAEAYSLLPKDIEEAQPRIKRRLSKPRAALRMPAQASTEMGAGNKKQSDCSTYTTLGLNSRLRALKT